MSNKDMIHIDDARFGYFTGFQFRAVITGVSLMVSSGEFVVIEGPNGCGKSTILRALLKLGAHSQGMVSLNASRSEIGYVPQEATLEPAAPATASDVVRSAFPFGPIPRGRIDYVLSCVGLENEKTVRYGSLSGGQQRRVLLARAIAHKTKLIILDEPTTNIDRKSEQLLETLLFELAEQQNIAILATTHASGWAKSARRVTLNNSGNYD